jgi:hypothetical protein
VHEAFVKLAGLIGWIPIEGWLGITFAGVLLILPSAWAQLVGGRPRRR